MRIASAYLLILSFRPSLVFACELRCIILKEMQLSRAVAVLQALTFLNLPLYAQARYRVTSDGEWFHQEPGGRRLARLARGAVVSVLGEQGEWLRVTIDGWIFSTSVGPSPRAGFDLAVTRTPDENLRSAKGGALVAKLTEGFLLVRLGEDKPWVRVKRDGWVQRTGLEAVAEVAARRAAADSSPDALTPGPRPGDSADAGAQALGAQPARQTTVYRAPDGPEAGSLNPETPLRVLSRTGEWARVQLEGWVKTTDLQDAPPGVLVGVSAAELRADPERYAGQTLRWTLQFIATQRADDLRPDLPPGSTYLLARGPLPEHGFVYVIVPDAQRPAIETLSALAVIRVIARVRVARSRFLGNPVVDLLSLEANE
jgi:hypothetical protein